MANAPATRQILVTGSVEQNWLNVFFEKLFQVKYAQNETEVKTDRFTCTVLCDLNRAHFDAANFKEKSLKLKNSGTLEAIITIENCNPRPETLITDVNILTNTYGAEYVKKYLYVFFTFPNHSVTLKGIRDDVLAYRAFFQLIMLNSSAEKENFVQERVWILHENNLDELKEIAFLREKKQVEKEPSFIKSPPFLPPINTNSSGTIVDELADYSLHLQLTTCNSRKVILVKQCRNYDALMHESFNEFFKACDYVYQWNASFLLNSPVSLSLLANDSKCKNSYLFATPIDAFILLLNYDKDKSVEFIDVARTFISSFGTESVKSLLLLTIKTSMSDNYFHSQDQLRNMLEKTEGYKYLKNLNNGFSIACCLWNYQIPRHNQQIQFENCITGLQPFSKIMMKYSFELIQKDIECEKLKRELSGKRNTSSLVTVSATPWEVPAIGRLNKFFTKN